MNHTLQISAPSWLGWTQAWLSWASLQLEGKHFQNLLSGKDRFSTCSSPLPWRQEVHRSIAQNKTRWCLLWSRSNMTLVMTTPSPSGVPAQVRITLISDMQEGMAVLPFSLAATPHLWGFFSFTFAVVPHLSPVLIPSSLSLVTPAHGALTFHPFPLRAWSGAYPPNSYYPLIVLKSDFPSTCCALEHPPQPLMANDQTWL